MKQDIKVGDYVVCTLKERKHYFNDAGAMDKFLNEKAILLVKFSSLTSIRAWDEETNETWLFQKEDLKLIWSKPYVDTYIVKEWAFAYRVYDTKLDLFRSVPLSLDDAQKVADIYNKSLNDNKLNKKEVYHD